MGPHRLDRARLPLALGALAAASLAGLALADAAGWMVHGPQPPRMAVWRWGALFLGGWTLMTGAMMLPSSLPFLRAVQRLGGQAATAVAGAAFTLAWVLLGGVVWALLWLAGGALATLGPGGAEAVAGAGLVLAGAYQASALAGTCQRACARPFAVLARHWHGGRGGPLPDAARAGLRYGATCIGCCLPMVVVMFVVGTNDLLWMLALALLMLGQKHPRWGPRLRRPVAGALVAAGIAIGLGWWQVPLHTLRALCGA